MTTPQLMALNPSATLAAVPSAHLLADWARNQLYLVSEGTAANCGIRQFTGYPSGDETLTKTIGALGISEIHTTGAAISLHGYLAGNEFTSNSSTIWETYGPTGSLVNQFGVAGSSLSPSDGTRILTPGSMAPVRWGSADGFISCPEVSGFGECCYLSAPSLLNTNLGALTESLGYCGPGAVGATTGTAFVLGVGGTTNLGLYKVTVTALGAAMVRSGSITPASVDATWSSFASAAGCAYDQTDGNVIIYCHSTGHTNNDYLVKVNASTAAVIWACPIGGSVNPYDLAQYAITRQTIYYIGSAGLYTINTSTGVATTQTIGSLTITGSQVSEDIYGSIVGYGSWTETTTHPTYIGTYMGAEGNHTLNNQWFRFMPNGAITPPAPPAVPKPGIVSVNRTWGFNLDGHSFYVLDLGTQGTFVYDETTGGWCEFQTAGSNWNMVNGCMWGQRIVAGDIATSDLWELDPAATKDSGGLYELSHIVTGGLTTRSRVYVSCDAVRISASFGLVDTTGVSFNLRYSDNQGNTWSSYFPITLTAADFDSEIAWRSLGSFCAPGRLFEFSDSGGLIRIDGCDAFLNGFDEQGGEDGG